MSFWIGLFDYRLLLRWPTDAKQTKYKLISEVEKTPVLQSQFSTTLGPQNVLFSQHNFLPKNIS